IADQLKFLDTKCNLVHGDISVNNVVIVRKLPNIITTLPPLSLSSRNTSLTDGTQSKALPSTSSMALNPASSVLESSTASAISEQTLPLSSAPDPTSSAPEPNLASSSMVVGTIGDEEKSFWDNPSMKSYGKNGLTYDVQSGGSIIDFDCSHDATEIQSVLTRSDLKAVDLNFLAAFPEDYVNDYWAPFSPFLTKLLHIVYPTMTVTNMDSRMLNFEEFRSTLVEALTHLSKIPEVPHKYAAFGPYKPSGSGNQKRSRTESVAMHPNTRQRTRFSQVQAFQPLQAAD
ncbi:hypothetical protein HYPSUDRAFT_60149, partial [Hypholoma sublateritium FD-334 SS-4]